MATPHYPTEVLRQMGHKGKISVADLTKAEELVREGVKKFPSGCKRA